MFFRGIHHFLKMIFYILAILGGIGNFTEMTLAGSSHSLKYPNLRSNEAIKARRGCASFGHSCYGGHGKRGGPFGHGFLISAERPAPWDSSFPKHSKFRSVGHGGTVIFAPSIRGSPKLFKKTSHSLKLIS